jgi:hypothetical protein
MSIGFNGARRRIGVVAVSVVALLAASAPAGSALAASSATFGATFTERTTFVACPAGVPAGSHCFEGVGHGTTTPPVLPDPNSVENFAGFVTPTGQDANIVSISTNRGTLFLTTQGLVGNGGATESGTWTARGGTGIFEDARGTGPVNTVLTGVNADGSVNSQTVYGGQLTLE